MNSSRKIESIRTEPLWNNTHIKFKGKPLFFQSWCKAGLYYVQDLWEDGRIKTVDELQTTVGPSAFLQFQYNAITNAIPQHYKTAAEQHPLMATVHQEIRTSLGQLHTLSNKVIRNFFDRQRNQEICAVPFWQHKLNIDITKYFTNAQECTKESRLRLLHFKFVHNIYPTNILLHKMGIANSNKCLWCPEVDYIEHAFFACPMIRQFWTSVKQTILAEYDTNITLDVETALFGVPKDKIPNPISRKEVNHLLLIARLSISKFKYGKCKNLTLVFEAERRQRIKV